MFTSEFSDEHRSLFSWVLGCGISNMYENKCFIFISDHSTVFESGYAIVSDQKCLRAATDPHLYQYLIL